VLGTPPERYGEEGLDRGYIVRGLDRGYIVRGLDRGYIVRGLDRGYIVRGLDRGYIVRGIHALTCTALTAFFVFLRKPMSCPSVGLLSNWAICLNVTALLLSTCMTSDRAAPAQLSKPTSRPCWFALAICSA
jgi:hypothetical protein